MAKNQNMGFAELNHYQHSVSDRQQSIDGGRQAVCVRFFFFHYCYFYACIVFYLFLYSSSSSLSLLFLLFYDFWFHIFVGFFFFHDPMFIPWDVKFKSNGLPPCLTD